MPPPELELELGPVQGLSDMNRHRCNRIVATDCKLRQAELLDSEQALQPIDKQVPVVAVAVVVVVAVVDDIAVEKFQYGTARAIEVLPPLVSRIEPDSLPIAGNMRMCFLWVALEEV